MSSSEPTDTVSTPLPGDSERGSARPEARGAGEEGEELRSDYGWTRKLRPAAIPCLVAGALALVVGSLLVVDCTPLSSSSSACEANSTTCLPSGICPYAPYGVVLLIVGFLLLIVGIIGAIGRQPEGTEPHPEPPAKRRPPETARTKMQREAEERRAEREARER